MSTFVEVEALRLEGNRDPSKIIVNLDTVERIQPLSGGGCHIFFPQQKIPLHVSDPYSMFTQFAMQTVSSADLAKRFEEMQAKHNPKSVTKESELPKAAVAKTPPPKSGMVTTQDI
jgi:hypothetical protein